MWVKLFTCICEKFYLVWERAEGKIEESGPPNSHSGKESSGSSIELIKLKLSIKPDLTFKCKMSHKFISIHLLKCWSIYTFMPGPIR